MIREEAIDLLDNLIGMVEDNHNSDYDTALQMGIKALEQEPCEDCISRQSVEQLSRVIVHTTRDKADFLCNFWEGLRKLPPVTPQPKIGRWINQHVIYANATIDFKVCSECRYEFSYDAETGVSDANYCPNCGAKMQEVEE